MTSKTISSVLLVLTAFIWGTAFVAQSTGGDAIGAFSFNCIRNLIGFIVLLPVIVLLDHIGVGQKPQTKQAKKRLIISGIVCGTALCAASNLQQLGITLGCSVGKAGFLTSCYIVFVPVAGLFFGHRNTIRLWLGVALTVVGLYLLCIKGTLYFELPDILLIICALCFTVQIMLIDRLAPGLDPVRLSCIQFLTCGILSAIPMFFVEMHHSLNGIYAWLPAFSRIDAWLSILYAGVLSSGIAYTLQIVGQRNLNPTVASMIFSLESVFSAIAGRIILGDTMSSREKIGCMLIFTAVIISQLPERKNILYR